MFRNQYDGDNTTWSPQGRIHQVEYAMEAVKQGSCTIGLKSKTHSLLIALKRSPNPLASHQKKIIKIDAHIGVGFSGLSSDARVLTNFMRTEAMKSKMVYNRPIPTSRLVTLVGDKAQINTQRHGKRPYGVGLLSLGSKLYECSPSGNYFDYIGMAIGARAQSAKTYLEKHFEGFEGASLDELIKHGLFAIRDCITADAALSIDNLSIAYVGLDTPFTLLEGSLLSRYLDLLNESIDSDLAVDSDVAMATTTLE